MATEQANIKVNVNLQQAIKDFELLDKRVEETVDSINKLEAEIIQLEKEQKELGPKQLGRQRDYQQAIDKTKQRLKEEKQDLKQLNTERKKADKQVKELKKSQGDLNEATSIADRATGGLISSFKSMKLAIGGSIKSLGALKVAFIASGVGAFVVLLGSLQQAFTRSEEGQNKFIKLMSQIGNVVNNTLDIFADFGMSVINAGKALFKLAKGDLGGAARAFGEAKNNINDATDAIVNFTDTIKKEGAIVDDIANKRAKADKVDRQLILDRAEANRKFNELREKAADKENISIEERITALKEAGKIEEEITKKEIEAAKLRFEAKKAENELGKSTKEDLDEQARLQAAVTDLETKRLRRQKLLTAEITTALREEKAERKAASAQLASEYVFLPGVGFVTKEQFDKIKANGEAIQTTLDDFKKRKEDEEAETELQKLQLEEQRTLAELDRLNATEEQKMQIKKFYSDKYLELETNNKKKEENVDKMVAQAKIAQAGQVFALVGQIAKKGSKVGKIAAIGQTVISGIQSVQNAYTTAQASPITAVNPGYPLQQAIIAGAFSAAQLAKIIATNPESPAAAGGLRPTGGGAEPAVPQFNVVGATATSQLATAIGEQEQQPVQAYVVSQDVTTAQSLENNIITGATLGG